MVACINSAAFMVHRPVLKSNLHPLFEVLPLRQCYLRAKAINKSQKVANGGSDGVDIAVKKYHSPLYNKRLRAAPLQQAGVL
ncbi:hypothetical protein EYF80_016489 [Liparis tanakae]|uniref:Uncharacterized protein n=1 Tax=Liparis tanakae TaxID=230148 RepID=A0A4Z2I5K7_9TELE|nr:hypothetical protein EYF80_016489 [Liparis tanakae]